MMRESMPQRQLHCQMPVNNYKEAGNTVENPQQNLDMSGESIL